MDFYFESVNLNQWDLFHKVDGQGHIKTFLAVKSMKLGDIVLLYVGSQVKTINSGVYAWGRIVTEPFILQNSPNDYCNNKNTVKVDINEISYAKPLIDKETCKRIFSQFRSVHKIDESHNDEICRLLKIV